MANERTIDFGLHECNRTGAVDVSTRLAQSGRLPRITQVMAWAIRFAAMLDTGEAPSYAALARAAALTPERLSQAMKLLWLAPDIQQEILELPPGSGRHPLTETLVRPVANRLLWADQRRAWRELKTSLHLS